MLATQVATSVEAQQIPPGNQPSPPAHCFWRGAAPFCNGQCKSGERPIERSDCGDGACCVTGTKRMCCVDPPKRNEIHSASPASTYKCLDADLGTIGENGTKVQLWDCWGGQNQKWQVMNLGGGRIVNLQSHRCLDADLGTIGENGTKVQLWDCWGGQNQNWNWNWAAGDEGGGPIGNDFQNVQSNTCLDADWNTITKNGTKVQLWQCLNGDGSSN